MESLLAYVPWDRRAVLLAGTALPDRGTGAALFADISGFTPLTEALATALGPRQGVDVLTVQINRVYDALIAAVHRYGGSVIGFAGDAITCWFDDAGAPGGGARRATAGALAMQAAMTPFATLRGASWAPASASGQALALKVAVASGPARRFLVGDSAIQVLDVLAGRTLDRMAAAEHLAALGAFDAAGNRAGAGRALAQLGRVYELQGAYGRAREMLGAAQAAAWAAGDRATEAHALNNLGIVVWRQGEYTEAQALWEASLHLRQTLDDHAGIAASLNNLGRVAHDRGQYMEARALLPDGPAISRCDHVAVRVRAKSTKTPLVQPKPVTWP